MNASWHEMVGNGLDFLGNALLLHCYIRDVVFGCLKDIIRMKNNNNSADICTSRPAGVLKVSFVFILKLPFVFQNRPVCIKLCAAYE